MTDERQGEALWPALRALPRGSGVVIRHHARGEKERRALIASARIIARRRRLMVVVAGAERQAQRARADGFHKRSARIAHGALIHTVAVHNRQELVMAERAHADLIFVSPVFATRSHHGARALGRARFAWLARRTKIPVIALGGMTARRWRSLRERGAYGWAAIDALTPPQ